MSGVCQNLSSGEPQAGTAESVSAVPPLRVLYVHHAAPFGGASRSLYELLRNLPVTAVQPCVLTRPGQFQKILAEAQIDVLTCKGVAQFDNTAYSYYRGFRWLVLLRELAYLPTTFIGLFAARRRLGHLDLIHVNDITLAPVIWMASILFDCPIVVHVRSVQRPLSDWRGRFLALLLRRADRFIAIDETVARSLNSHLKAVVVHNGLTVRERPRRAETVPGQIFTVGMVGGLSRAKGCLDLLAAARICLEQKARIRFVFIGQSMRPPGKVRDFLLRLLGVSQEIEEELKTRIADWSLGGAVEFRPFTLELEKVYGQMDVLCFPSHFDAPGRPIFEAALYGVPSVAAITQPTMDTIIDGLTGLAIPPRDPARLAEAILFLANNRQKCREMGENAKFLAREHFDVRKNATRVLALYQELSARQPP